MQIRLLALFALAAAAWPQSFNTPSPPPWKRVTVTCSAAPTFDLSAATAFQITLCATAATANMTHLTRADGKIVSFLVCQDSAGARSFGYGAHAFGASTIDPRPGRCSSQTFLVAGADLWALAAGTNATNIPPPSLLVAPLSTMTILDSGGLVPANTSDDVTFTDTIADGTWKLFVQNPPAPTWLQPFTLLMSFWFESPPADKETSFGFTAIQDTTDPGKRFYCGYSYGTGAWAMNQGIWREWVYSFWNGTTPLSSSCNTTTDGSCPGINHNNVSHLGTTFLDASHNVFLKLSTTDGVTLTCTISGDNGSTWQTFAAFTPQGGWDGRNWLQGGLHARIQSSSTKVHLTGIHFSFP